MKKFEDLINDLEGQPGEPEEEFTVEELEEKLGKCLRLIEEIRIKEESWQIRFIEFAYQLNKMARQKCSIEEILNYFNLKQDKIFCEIDFLD
ncbi:hypothetical protein ES702_02245 [subsurface metagenome]